MQSNGETILVVEDSRQIQSLLRREILEPAGYRVINAYDAASGMALIRNADLLMLDINLPGVSGLEMLKNLRENGSNLPIIMITGESSEQMIVHCFRAGAQDFLEKPFTAEEALQAIGRALEQVRMQRENQRMQRELENANRKLQAQVRTLSNIQAIGQVITSSLEESVIQRRLMAGVNQLMQVEAGSLFLIDFLTSELVLQISLSGDMENQGEIRLQIGQGITGWVAQHRAPALVPDVNSDPRFFPLIDAKTGFKTLSLLAVPLIAKERVLGVLQVINPQGRKPMFDENDLEMLQALAAFVAVGLENARLHSQMRQSVTVETLRQATRTLSHFANNSLSVILMAAEKMRSDPLMSPEKITFLGDAIQTEARRINQAIISLRNATLPHKSQVQDHPDVEKGLQAWLQAERTTGEDQ